MSNEELSMWCRCRATSFIHSKICFSWSIIIVNCIYLSQGRPLHDNRDAKLNQTLQEPYGPLCYKAEYLLIFFIGAPSINDSLYKLALFKQLVNKSEKKWETINLMQNPII